jgi:ABC-2 type transport system ATP-binding protein
LASINAPLPAITVNGLHHHYPRATRAALTDIHFTIARGSFFGLLGPNGAGKSTMLGLLSGSLALQRGELMVAEHRLPNDQERVKQISAIVPQEYAFYEELSGLENLQYFAGVYGMHGIACHTRIDECAASCRLSEVLSQRAGDYSGGLKRRLNLAIGLLNKPEILYLDEPTVGIDAESRRDIIKVIQDLRQTGVTIIYTSHYMEEVEQLCDSVAVIDRGQVRALATMQDLLRREGERLLHIRLRQPVPALAESLSQFAATHVDFVQWQLEVGFDELPQVVAAIKAANAQVERLQFGVSRLEKIYLELLMGDA